MSETSNSDGAFVKARARWMARFRAAWDATPFLRIIVGLVGFVFLLSAYVFFVRPPTRTTITRDLVAGGHVEQIQPAESSAVAVALFTAACAALAFSLKLKIDPLALSREKDSPANAQPKEPSGVVHTLEEDHATQAIVVPAPVPASTAATTASTAAPDDQKIQAAISSELFRRADYFFRVSSWNGKKVLYACYLASRTPSKILDLRTVARRDQRMSFDYAYGYLVAASSTSLFQHGAPADAAFFEILDFPEQAAGLLLNHIEGQLDLPPADRPMKIAEIRAIAAFFNAEPPAFARAP